MADIIMIKRGTNDGLYGLHDGEIAYHTLEKALYIGTEKNGNLKLCSARKVEAQPVLRADADIEEVVTAFNNLIAALKAGEVMEIE